MNKIKTLEFEKIIEFLSSMAVMDIVKVAIEKIKIYDNIKKINRLQEETARSIAIVAKMSGFNRLCQ